MDHDRDRPGCVDRPGGLVGAPAIGVGEFKSLSLATSIMTAPEEESGMFKVKDQRWTVEVTSAGVSDRRFEWLKSDGPWYLITRDPRPVYPTPAPVRDFEDDDFFGLDEEDEHQCPTIRTLVIYSIDTTSPRAEFEIDRFDFTKRSVVLRVVDRDQLVELRLTPDLSHVAAQQLGVSEHPYQARTENTTREVERLKRR